MATVSNIFNCIWEIGEVTKITNDIENAIQGRSLNNKKTALINSMKVCNDMPIKTKTIELYIYCLSKTLVDISTPMD